MSTLNRKITILSLFLLLFFGTIVNITTKAYITEIEITGKTIIIDVSKDPFSPVYANIEGNLTDASNTVIIADTSLVLPDSTDALILYQPTKYYTLQEKNDIAQFLYYGNKTLIIGGDSDYMGYYNATCANDLLEFLGSKIRLDSTGIADPVYNDDMDYRVAAMNYSSGPIGSIISQNCAAGIIMHHPGSILGFEDSQVVDLRNNTIDGVEVLISYSNESISLDLDGSDTIYDIYSKDSVDERGNYPAVVCEKLTFEDRVSYIILAGEVIFSDYKKMYDQYTEAGVYNGGIHYGQMFVNNILNYFLANATDIVIDEFSTEYLFSLLAIFPFMICMTMIIRKKKK